MTVPGLMLRREFVFLALAVMLGLGAAAAYWVSRATVLTIAVAPSDGTEPAVIQAYADALAKRHKEIRLKILPFDDVRDSAAALQDGRAQRDRVVSERGQAEQALQKLSADRDAGTAAVEALHKRQTDAQGDLATLTETPATRNKEAASIDEQLASARQDLSTAQAKLAEVRQQVANPPAAPSQPAR